MHSVFTTNREISEIGCHGNLLSRSLSRRSWRWNDFSSRYRVRTEYKGRMLESGGLTSYYKEQYYVPTKKRWYDRLSIHGHGQPRMTLGILPSSVSDGMQSDTSLARLAHNFTSMCWPSKVPLDNALRNKPLSCAPRDLQSSLRSTGGPKKVI